MAAALSAGRLRVRLRPHTAGSELLVLGVSNDSKGTVANVVFANIQDRCGRNMNTEVGQIIVADVDTQRVASLLQPDREALGRLIRKA